MSQVKQLYISINTGTVLTKWYVKPYSCYLTLTLRDGHINSYVLRKKIFSTFLNLFCYSSNLSFWFPGYYQFKMSQVSMTLCPGFQSISFLQHFSDHGDFAVQFQLRDLWKLTIFNQMFLPMFPILLLGKKVYLLVT